MPRKLKTRCRYRGCIALTRDGYCPAHRSQRYQRPADKRRGTSAARGYDARWRKVRALYYQRHPLCEDCLEEGRLTDQGIEVDHVIPIAVRPDLRLALENLRSLCRRHHKRKTDRDQIMYAGSTTSLQAGLEPSSTASVQPPAEQARECPPGGGESIAAAKTPETTRPQRAQFREIEGRG